MKQQFAIISFLALVLVSSMPKPVKILMAGDSTMADKVLTKTVVDSLTERQFQEPFMERGWGQLLPEFVNQKAVVKNYAQNGRSTRTFIEEGLWTNLINNTEKGDFVIIQFGHNDSSKDKGERYTNPAQFRINFVAFVNEVKLKGATPILCTPVARRKFDENGKLISTHGIYPDIIRQVAKQYDVPLIDMEKLTSQWLQQEGVEASKKYFHKFPPGVSKLYPQGLDDNTHFNELGAKIVAAMFVNEVKNKHINGLMSFIKQ